MNVLPPKSVGNGASNLDSSQYGALFSLMSSHEFCCNCGKWERAGGRADSCQGKIKRVSAGAGERGASDEGPLRSNPTG